MVKSTQLRIIDIQFTELSVRYPAHNLELPWPPIDLA